VAAAGNVFIAKATGKSCQRKVELSFILALTFWEKFCAFPFGATGN